MPARSRAGLAPSWLRFFLVLHVSRSRASLGALINAIGFEVTARVAVGDGVGVYKNATG